MTSPTPQDLGDRELRSLLELQSRVRAATGPGRELGIAIYDALGIWKIDGRKFRQETDEEIIFAQTVPDVTSSIDAALALVERVLPATLYSCGNMEYGPFCSLLVPMLDRGDYIGAREIVSEPQMVTTLPLAILDALLSALIAQSKSPAAPFPTPPVEER